MALCAVDVFDGGGDLGLFQGLDVWGSGEVTRRYVRLYPWRGPLAFDACDPEDSHHHLYDAYQPVATPAFPHPGGRAPAALVGDGALLVGDRDPAGPEPGKQQLVYLFSVLKIKKSHPAGAGRLKSLSGFFYIWLFKRIGSVFKGCGSAFLRIGSSLAFQG